VVYAGAVPELISPVRSPAVGRGSRRHSAGMKTARYQARKGEAALNCDRAPPIGGGAVPDLA